ncbi:VWA domain-containing protein [Botrimarina sp.]|uniref:vWA domain-containing protein n=1 Tax=Botrimarina sp. TaxID=2795802 RepID=UPI0032F09220
MNDSQTSNQDPRDDARDRFVDRVLAEAIGGERPPDLSARIADRREEQKVAAHPSEPAAGRGARGRGPLVRFAIAATVLVGVSLLLVNSAPTVRDTARRMNSGAESHVELRPKSALPEQREANEPRPQAASDSPAGIELSQPSPATRPARPSSVDRGAAVVTDGPEPPEPSSNDAESAGVLLAKSDRSASQGVSPAALQRRLGDEPLFEAAPSSALPAAGGYGGEFGIAAGGRAAPATPGDDIQLRFAQPDTSSAAARARHEESYSRLRSQSLFTSPQSPTSLPPAFRQADSEHRGWQFREPPSRDRYADIQENHFVKPDGQDALSTFSVDVDTASYTNVRQYLLDAHKMPPAAAVRIEELVNYFDYDYPAPAADSEDPFAASMEVGRAPWKPEHLLVRIGIQGKKIDVDKRPLTNLVFLVDVSGSMNQPNKLPLVVAGLQALVDRLGENDRVAIVVYAGNEGVVLPSTSGMEKDEIRSALGRLTAVGSTAGGAGLRLAYEIAERNKITGGVNRVVLCTDGDFNVGVTGTEELATMAQTRAKETGVFLTVLGFGRGNLNDEMLEAISGRGDGHYAYIDSEREARRVLSTDLAGTLVTIAKDVKLQVEFNPQKVAAYRLIGYENRLLAAEDFNDDTKDAGEIGAGHTVTALYEVVPVGAEPPEGAVDDLKYQQAEGRGQQADSSRQRADSSRQRAEGGRQTADGSGRTAEDDAATSGAEPEPRASALGAEPITDSRQPTANELLTLKIRYKQPEGGASKKLEFPLEDPGDEPRQPTIDHAFASAVAQFGMLLRDSKHAGDGSYDQVLDLARDALGDDPHGRRAEFLDLVRRARELAD